MNSRLPIGILIALLWVAAAMAHASNGVIRLSSFPSMSVADGRSTVTISAEVRDRNGQIVPDGTQVVFSASLGNFVEPIVKTSSGYARAIFQSGSTSGLAKIQAAALTYNAVSTLELELVADRSLLSAAKEYIEISSDSYMMYSMDQRVIGAASPNYGVTLKFRDIVVRTDDIQINIPSREFKARKAKIRYGKFEREFSEVAFKLNSKEGIGITQIEIPNYQIAGQGKYFKFEKTLVPRMGLAKIKGTEITPNQGSVPDNTFEFSDLLDSTSTISAKTAICYPRGQIQFHRASMYVGTQRVLSMPLYQLDMNSSSQMVTDQVLNVYNSQVAVNYPYYLSLKPGETSAIRFRTGEQYGRNSTSLGGVFVDYEWNWNKGENMDGGLSISGMNRSDWSIGARQYLRIDPQTVASAQIEFPAHRSMYGSTSIQRTGDGFQLAVNASSSRAIRGVSFATTQYSAVIEKDPTKVGNLPLRLFYGVTANYNSTVSEASSFEQNSVGARLRMQLLPIRMGSSTISASASVSQLSGKGVNSGLTTFADMSLSHQFGAGAAMFLGYSYTNDGYSSALTGHNNFNVSGVFDQGRTSFSFTGSKSLDVDRQSFFADASYHLSEMWRFSVEYTADRFLGDRYDEDLAMLSYRIGVREIGVTYSYRKRRIGFQLFGTQL